MSDAKAAPRPETARPTPFRPTPAFVRSVLLGGALTIVAAIAAKPLAVLLAVPFLAYAAWGWAMRPTGKVTATTQPASAKLREGDSLAMTVRIDPPHPTATTVVDFPALIGFSYDPTSAATFETGDARVTVEPSRWGRYVVPAPQVAVTDDARAWRADVEATAVVLAVRPGADTLPGSAGLPRPIGLAGVHTAAVAGEGTSMADLREFRTGDRLRRVNWRVTSRTGRLHVTTTLADRDTDVLIVTDSLIDIPGPTLEAATSMDWNVRAATAIATHYLDLGDRVGVHDMGRKMPLVRVGAGRRQSQVLLEAIARIDRTSGASTRYPRRVARITPGTLVFFCSPLLSDEALNELVRLRRLGADVIAVDTMPEGTGVTASLRIAPSEPDAAAWVLRRMERETVVSRLRELGIQVVEWRGPGSLAGVLLTLQRSRNAPRMARR